MSKDYNKEEVNKIEPRVGFSTRATVLEIHDGDTLTLSITRTFPVRLLNLDTPELSTPEGKEARRFLSDKLLNKEVVLFIPANRNQNLMDINSFNRILGEIWYDGKNISQLMKEAGFIKNE